ncbi:Mce-associated membrane protein [Kitasatospora gansuensis]|uniref:Mce-associated membrane protein n=1 Tax=Kitasatospora gansuensis TaxID=258050 RepID=A0A7W7SHL4_9ACTN|nr:hypothetical protein [Kitasatospora gansuensis]MBB4950643.1 Mce-associated membrane protein [Kitasatospora gansuensis]
MRRHLHRAALLLVLLAGLALLVTGQLIRSGADTADHALTDRAATDRVAEQVGAALGRAFSYSATDSESTRTAARAAFAGAAGEQYKALTEQLGGWVGEQQLTLTSRVVSTGVVRLTADRAELLVLLDQSARRAEGPPTRTAAQLLVSARLDGGRWLVTELKSL